MVFLHFLDFIIRLVPIWLLMKLGRGLGTLFFWLDRKHRRIALGNLKAAFPEYPQFQIRGIARRAFQHLVLVGLEVLVLSRKSPLSWRHRIFDEGIGNLEKAGSQGKAILFLTGHVGNWELLAKLGRWAGFIESVVARDVRSKKAQSLLNRIRARYRVNVIGKGQIRHIIREFQNNRTVGALIDQDGGRRGMFVPFFGRPASTPTGIIRLGLKSGVSILPAFLRRLSDSLEYRVWIGPDLSEGLEGTTLAQKEKIVLERFTQSLEKFIREDPAQWLWLHRRWKTRPASIGAPPRRKALLLNDGKAGHFNQVLGIMRGLAGWESQTCKIEFKSPFHRWVLYAAALLRIRSIRILRWSLTRATEESLPVWAPSLVLACGSASAPVAYALRHYYGAKTAVLMRSGLPRIHRLFDLVILPSHDRPSRASNVMELMGMPTLMSDEVMEEGAKRLLRQVSLGAGKKIGVLLGGTSDRLRMKAEHIAPLVESLLQGLGADSLECLVATSRRTPADVERLLKSSLQGKPRAHLFLKDHSENPVPGILGLSDAVLATEDSFSMLMEAVHSGRPVISLGLPRRGLRPLKYEKTLQTLERQGRIRRVGIRQVASALDSLLKEESRPRRANNLETSRAVQSIENLFFEAQ